MGKSASDIHFCISFSWSTILHFSGSVVQIIELHYTLNLWVKKWSIFDILKKLDQVKPETLGLKWKLFYVTKILEK